MATTADTWFYRQPERVPYFIAERVNNTYWDARLTGLWLAMVKGDTSPYVMAGTYNGSAVQLEWEPSQWLRLTTNPSAPHLAAGTANILRRKAALTFETAEGAQVWEWWLTGLDQRWQAVQGKPAYRNPRRLDQAS